MRAFVALRAFTLAVVAGAALQANANPLQDWNDQVELLAHVPAPQQLQAVTDWVHLRIGYADDPDDVWESPLEALVLGSGDCEDFAIAKYALLRELGWQPPHVRLAYGYTTALGKRQAHMVVLVDEPSLDDPLVLDNLGDFPVRLSSRSDLEITFSFSEQTLWKGPTTAQVYGPARRLAKWARLVERMRAEGTLPPQ